MKYGNFHWPPGVAGLKEHCMASEMTACRQAILQPRTKLCPPDPTIPFKLCRRRFPIKTTFPITITKPKGQIFQRVGMCQPSPVFPMGNPTWCFPDPLHVTTLLLQSVKREKTNKMQQSDVYYQLLSQHVSGIIMPIFRRTKTVLLHMVYCSESAGCGW